MTRVEFSEAAEEDLCDIVEYIAKDKPTAARTWLASIRERCDMLASNPELGAVRPGYGVEGCKSFSAGSYVIFFRNTKSGIEVARIIHGSRDLGDPQ